MSSHNKRTYRGTIKLVILDWAGTTIDHGSIAPAAAFVEVFRRKGIDITIQQAREPMGMDKRDHIRAISQMAPVASQWQMAYGRPVSADDVEQMYRAFVPVLLDILASYSELSPGTVECANELRRRGILIGSTTGYFEEALAVCRKAAAVQGFVPDLAIGASQVTAGRPAPWMVFETMKRLAVYPVEAVVKVGDTVLDVEAGQNAGVWTVGVAQTGNEIGLPLPAWQALPEDEKTRLLDKARTTLSQAGADYVIDTIAELPAIIETVNQRLAAGLR